MTSMTNQLVMDIMDTRIDESQGLMVDLYVVWLKAARKTGKQA